MNGTAVTANLLSGMSDARQRESNLEELERLSGRDLLKMVSNNLGVYFLFCLFGLAILALFLCRSSMQALQTSLSFFVYVAKFGRFLCINKFLQRGTLDMIEWGQKSKPKKIPGPKFSLQTIPCQSSKP